MMAAMYQMLNGSFSSHDPLFSSSVRPSSSSGGNWTMPTPPVSPSHEDDHFVDVNRLSDQQQHIESSSSSSGLGSPSSASSSDEDLDLGLGDILGGLGDLAGCWENNEWLFEDLYGQTQPMGSLAVSSCPTANGSCDVMRHDCMWAGHCPAEEHRIKKEQPSMLLLSSSPTESAISMLNPHHHQASSTVVVTRTRLNTLGSIRPETPLSLSDSEMETDQLTADECSNTNRRSKDFGSCTSSSSSSSSSSGDESEDDDEEEDEPMLKKMKPTLPPNIHPVRSSHHIRKLMNAKASIVPTLPDHSYSHSDHSYHTQRRPVAAAAPVATASTFVDANAGTTTAALLGIQTPSDSEEEIDVVSLGEVLRMNPAAVAAVRSSVAATSIPAAMVAAAVSSSSHNGSKMSSIGLVASSSSVSSQQHSASHQNAPIRLKLKVTPVSASTSSGSMMQRKALPSQPSAFVRQQLQLAVATAAAHQQQQHRKQPAVKKEAGVRSTGGKKSRSMSAAAASTDSSDSSSCSPRKAQQQQKAQQSHRSSRAGSDSEDSCEKRSQHNSMERQRRVDLRNAFEFLRSLIPDLETTDRAAKVVILKKAANFCQGLTQREKQYMAEKDALQKRHEMLRKRISLLQRRR